MSEHEVWAIDPMEDAELVRRVYARSWPVTARADYPDDEVIQRLGDRDLLYWQRTLVEASIRFAAGPSLGGFGFLLASPQGDGWDVTHVFLEPEAFKTGMADALGAAALARLQHLDPGCKKLGSWILQGNTRSQAAAERTGWSNKGVQRTPWSDTGKFYRYELEL